MKIKIKYCGKIIQCDVSNENCKSKSCLSPHKYIHKNKTIDGTLSTYQDDFYSCSTRNYHGCPSNKVISSEGKKV